jgi:hypothetical protein
VNLLQEQRGALRPGGFSQMVEVRVEMDAVPTAFAVEQARPRDDAAAERIPTPAGTIARGGEPEVRVLLKFPAIGAEEDRRELALRHAVIASHSDPAKLGQAFLQIEEHPVGWFLETGKIRVMAANRLGDAVAPSCPTASWPLHVHLHVERHHFHRSQALTFAGMQSAGERDTLGQLAVKSFLCISFQINSAEGGASVALRA